MNRLLALSFGLIVTLAMLALAAAVGLALWGYYMDAPWTRDGHVRADVVSVAPDVSGLVTEVLVEDNQKVKRGDLLFRIDPERFALALRQAEAAVTGKQARGRAGRRRLPALPQAEQRGRHPAETRTGARGRAGDQGRL
jgi:multidrug resistance efflux pump